MNKTKAASLARTLMNKHGLGHVPFEFDRGKTRLGACHWSRATRQVTKITISSHYTELLPEDEIRYVILHEIAHALAGFNQAHGPAFVRQARALGIKPDVCASPSASPKGAWSAVCPAGHSGSRDMHRAPGRVRSCSKCSPGKFNADAILIWSKDGRKVPISSMPAKYQQELRSIQNRYILTALRSK